MNKEQIDKQIDRRAEEIEKLRVQVNKLQIQVDCLTEELQHQKDTPGTTEIDRALLSPGDRIQILNAVKRPKNWNAAKPWNHLEAKRATVTCVFPGTKSLGLKLRALKCHSHRVENACKISHL